MDRAQCEVLVVVVGVDVGVGVVVVAQHTHIRKIYVYYVPTLGVVVPLGPYVERV